MSELLTKSLARGRLIVRKRKTVSGEVMITFGDKEPLFLQTYSDVNVSEILGINHQNVQKSNLRRLLSLRKIEIVYE